MECINQKLEQYLSFFFLIFIFISILFSYFELRVRISVISQLLCTMTKVSHIKSHSYYHIIQ